MLEDILVLSLKAAQDPSAILPPELLAHIFLFLTSIYPLNLAADPGQELGWVYVTHVCRRWRATALSTPSLWTRLSPDMGPVWEVFIERSKAALLFIEGRFNMNNVVYAPGLLPSLHKHQDRIQELCLSKLSPPFFVQLFNRLTGPLPNLRALAAVTCQYDFPVPRLPPDFLSSIAPNLRELRLSGVDFPSDAVSSLLSNLESLFFDDGPPTVRKGTASFPDIVLTLSRMTCLRTLRLVMTLLDSKLPVDAHSDDIVVLSHIEVLVIESKNDTCWHLWSRLRVPSFADVHVHSAQPSGVESLIVSTLQAHLACSPPPNFLGMYTYSVGSRESHNLNFRLRGGDTNDHKDPRSARGRPSLELGICTVDAEPLCKRLLAILPLESICDLQVTEAPGISRPFERVRDLLLPLRSVTHLRLADGVTCAALEPSSIPGTEPNDKVLFPALVEIRAVSLRPTTYIAFSRVSSQIKDALRRTLDHRNRLGANRLKLVLRRDQGWEEYVAQWYVKDEVIWVDRGDGT
ncbi:hypothetical protein PENSPDRAFT_657578 [Peniophora sp. CONT]|nr:hypothetical protein PENSPDRAFT_657578 [Peniophora sp. CONT]